MEVVQRPSSGELMYNILVHDAKSPNSEPLVFRTDGLINDDGAKSPLGRGTRVWRVKRLVDGEPDDSAPGRVLKDSWVDEDRDRERDSPTESVTAVAFVSWRRRRAADVSQLRLYTRFQRALTTTDVM